MLEIRNLYKSYKSFKVLDGLSMKVDKGDIYGFLGKNGCGKTTTMNIICNIIPKDEGEIWLGESGGENVRIGYLPETPALYPYMNGYEYLGYIAYVSRYQGDVQKRIDQVLSVTGMTEGGKRRIKGYSRGMNQRLGIAAAIFTDPELLILDEPTSALDPEGRAEVMAIIKRLNSEGCTIILCTHILSDVERVANRVGILSNGRLAVEGGINDIIDSYRSDSVEISLLDTDPEKIEAFKNGILETGVAKAVNYYAKSSLIVADVEDAAEGMRKILGYIAYNGTAVRSVKLSQPTLEQVYLDIVGR